METKVERKVDGEKGAGIDKIFYEADELNINDR